MSGNVFPSTHTTATSATTGTRTTTTTTSTSPDQRLFINIGFLRTEHGWLKVAQMVVCLLAFICAMSSGYPFNIFHGINFISFITICGMLVSGILLFLYFINAVVYFTVIPWVLMELIYCALWTFLSFVGGIVGSTLASSYISARTPYGATAFFLFIGMLIYGYSSFKLLLLHRKGVRLIIVTTEVTTVTQSSTAA